MPGMVPRFVGPAAGMTIGADFDWSRRRLLVIEDDAETLERIRAIFTPVRLGGLEVLRDGGKVTEVLARFPADLVLMEANPAGTDGLEVLRAIRGKESPNRDVIVAVMVAMADAERLRRMSGIGIESFIRKPVTGEVLLARVAGAITNPRRFISSLTYFGPDRRRPRPANDPYLGPEKRRIVKVQEPQPPPRAATPPPAAKVPAQRPVDDGDKSAWCEAAPGPQKPRLADNVPLVDAVGPKKPKAPEKIEVVEKPAKKKTDDDDWASELAPKEKKVEEDTSFDIAGMVAGHSEWLQSGGTAGSKAVLEGQDPSGADMAGVNLSGATLRNVILQTANLRAASSRASICAARSSRAPTSPTAT
ncbi:MAG: response regulator [Alphaproteobacteria bacterium]|nr:response regulator [Alphaproteobacteria bacterium]